MLIEFAGYAVCTGPHSMAPPEVLRPKGHTNDPPSTERRRQWLRHVAASFLGSACILSFGSLLLRRTAFLAYAVVTDDAPVPCSATEGGGSSSSPRFPGASNRSAEAESLPSGPWTNAESAAGRDGSRAKFRGREMSLALPPLSPSSASELANTETVQIIEQLWSTSLNRGAAQREGSGTPSIVEWKPLYPTLRVPGSNPQSRPELKAYHGLGRVELPGLALACAPSTSTQSAPITSVIVAPGGAYKFVGVPGKPEADSVPNFLSLWP